MERDDDGSKDLKDDIYKTFICDKCKGKINYSEEFDCHYCEKCNEWLNNICEDPQCTYCNKRPETPFKKKKNGKLA